jgi:hypothetical protein
MKNSILALLAIFLISTSAFALNTQDPEVVKAQKTNVVKNLKLQIDYPDFAIENKIQGHVYVSFNLDQAGNIIIEEIHSTQAELKEYVIEELKKINIPQNDEYINLTYEMRFKFDLL